MTDKAELLRLAIRLQDFALAEGCPTAAMRDAAAILRKLAGKPERKAQDDGGYDLVAAWDRSGLLYPDDMVDPVFQAGWDAAKSTT